MKRLSFLLLLLWVAMNAFSQNMFVCTNNNVNVWKGPGKFFPVLRENTENQDVWQIPKNEIVRYLGKKKSGFMLVEAKCPVDGSMGYEIEKGWVYAQFFKQLTKKCPECHGKGYFEYPCGYPDYSDDDHERSCTCWLTIITPNGYVELAGRQICVTCKGYGYIN